MTTRALEIGAIDCVTKPSLGDVRPFGDLADKVRMAAGVRMMPGGPTSARGAAPTARSTVAYAADGRIVAIGSSTGGVEALTAVLTGLPADCAPVVVTQHMPPLFTRSFAERLDKLCAAAVAEATDGAPLVPGRIYIAPGGSQHLEVSSGSSLRGSANPPRCRLRDGAPVNGHCPSVDVLFRSVVRTAGAEAVGVILTGMGRDGAEGPGRCRDLGPGCRDVADLRDAEGGLRAGCGGTAASPSEDRRGDRRHDEQTGQDVKTMPLASVLKVMIADDQQTSRLLIRSALSDIGITNVAMAKDGDEALQMLMKTPVHLIVSDYHMPKMNGVELLRAVRSHGPTQKSAFFLLTGVEDKEFLQLAMSLKVNNYLKKPVSVPELKKKIEAVFGALQ